jgi:hypothetical protein
MKVSRLLPWVTLLALFGAAPNASATIVKVEYTGVVRSGTDDGGLFGPQGADLTHMPFVLDFIFDTTIGVVTRQPTLNVIEGGSDLGSPFDISPNLSAQIEIDGKSSPKIVGSFFSVMQAANGDSSNINQQLHSASDGLNTRRPEPQDRGGTETSPPASTFPCSMSLARMTNPPGSSTWAAPSWTSRRRPWLTQ